MRPHPFLVLVVGLTAPATAQSLDPRSFVNTPVGMNFVSAGYGYSSGNVLFDPSVALDSAELVIQGPAGGYARALDLGGLSGKVDAAAGWACADGHAQLEGERVSRHICGLTDPTAHISVNVLGAPAVTLREYPKYRQNVLVGAGLRVTAPLGQYDPARLVNIGAHRWVIKPELAVSKAVGRLTLELLAAVSFFTTNGDFLDGHTQSQAPLYSGQVNVIYTFRSGVWGGIGGVYYGGGATRTDGGPATARQENTRTGAVLVVPIGRRNSLKLSWITGVTTRTGSDFDTFSGSWTYRWGGRR